MPDGDNNWGQSTFQLGRETYTIHFLDFCFEHFFSVSWFAFRVSHLFHSSHFILSVTFSLFAKMLPWCDHFHFTQYLHKCHEAEVLWLWWISLSLSSFILIFFMFCPNWFWHYLLICLVLTMFWFMWTRCKIYISLFVLYMIFLVHYIYFTRQGEQCGRTSLLHGTPFGTFSCTSSTSSSLNSSTTNAYSNCFTDNTHIDMPRM